jgi:hypothetical protein
VMALHGVGSITTGMEAAAKTLGVSPRTVRRLIARYTASAKTTSLIAHLRGLNKPSAARPGNRTTIGAAIHTPYALRRSNCNPVWAANETSHDCRSCSVEEIEQRLAFTEPATEEREMLRHYMLGIEDLALIDRRRADPNRLGFAVFVYYLRFPGQTLRQDVQPPAAIEVNIEQAIGTNTHAATITTRSSFG